VSAAVMPRGGLEPMWQLGSSIGLPIWAGRKQGQAVTESEQRSIGQTQSGETIRQILRLRTHERLKILSAVVRTSRRLRDGLLVLSEATTRSAIAQYEVGQLPFSSVLEALSGFIADRGTYLDSIADAQRIAIAQREVSLDPTAAPSVGASRAGKPGGGAPSSKPSSSRGASQSGGSSTNAPSSGSSSM